MTKQKFKGQILTTTKTVNSILRVYDAIKEPELYWYDDAQRLTHELAIKYATDIEGDNLKVARAKVAGIISALSPLKSWDENKKIAEQYLKTAKANHVRAFEKKCDDIMDSDGSPEAIADILNGNKITSFFLNIMNPRGCNQVTIDRHAISIAVGEKLTDDKLQITTGQYQFFVNCYMIASEKRGILPLQMQASTWVAWRQ